jgi:hypothetical protein
MTMANDMRLKTIVTATAVVFAVQTLLFARIDVKVEYDKGFDFKTVRSWEFGPQGPGQVKMARTQYDDPEAMHKRTMPLIVEAITSNLTQRGLVRATPPDLVVTYYLLLSTSISSQTMGQFLPATTFWGLPPFPPATQSMEVMNRGSLVLDLSAKDSVVWRGLAQANIKMDTDEKKRESLLRDAIRDLLRRYPPRR